jgi:hypothetical protein
MRKELEIITDIFGPNDKLVKRNVIYKKMFEMNDIEVEQFISNKGLVSKKFCAVVVENKYYKVKGSYEHVKSLVSPVEVKGFMGKTRRR